MSGYVLNFVVYTLAMTGMIFFALFIYKKVMNGGFHSSDSHNLSIEETLNINPRKNLMIVKAGDERFLIASDIDKTTLLAKLENCDTKILTNNDSENIANNFENIIKSAQSSEINQEQISFSEEKREEQPAKTNKKTVHLEVIHDKNPAISGLRKNSYTSKNYYGNKSTSNNIESVRKKVASPMKDMAAKVNEL